MEMHAQFNPRPEIPGWGSDRRMEDRPGVPMEHAPAPVSDAPLDGQTPTAPVLTSAPFHRLTPVFSTALPPRGLSGLLRRRAYGFPDHDSLHWVLLLLADPIDVLESAARALLGKRPFARGGLIGLARAYRNARRHGMFG
jgi:hypothetical protein